MKKIILYIIIAAELFLCSCGRLYSALGIDKKDYSKEAVTATIMDDDQLIARLAQSACIVCFKRPLISRKSVLCPLVQDRIAFLSRCLKN